MQRSTTPTTNAEVERGHTVGGQALVEGVLMRGPDRIAMAARTPDGSITVRTAPLPRWTRALAAVPLLRGVAALAESVQVGVEALQWSASIADPRQHSARAKAGSMLVAALAVVAALGIFTAVPAVVASWTIPVVGAVGRTVVEGALGAAMLVAYIGAIRRHPLVLRTFGYHGAEHKAIAAYEAEGAFDAMAASAHTTRHERCGTTFMLDVAVLSAALHIVSNVVWPSGPAMVAARLLAVPVVAGLAYELLRATARHRERRWARAATRPGLWLQSLTTTEPDLGQLEVAVVALRAALPEPAVSPRPLPAPSTGRRATGRTASPSAAP